MNDLKVSVSQPEFRGVFNSEAFQSHEQVVFCSDPETGLKAIIGIHSTALGPALGGTRMWSYQNETEAIRDVLRLSRGMTFKASISGLKLGGGKAVIIGDSRKDKTDALMAKFGEYVNSLGGRYITAEDVGMSTHDMKVVKSQTDYVTGIPEEMGGSGNPSPVTAYGVYMGMKAAARYRFGSDDLKDKKVMVQGIGHVGRTLVNYLCKEGAEVWINDLHEESLQRVAEAFDVRIYRGNELYRQDVDIYAPCALGATLNEANIKQLKCSIVAGAANNQLADENADAERLMARNIIYAPDFLINAGGLINVYSEIADYSREDVMRKTENIYDTTLEILKTSEVEKITPHQAALSIAEARVEEARRLKNS